MDPAAHRDLLGRLAALEAGQVKLRQGVMTASDAVEIGASGKPYEGVVSLAPVEEGDRVSVLMVRNDLLVLGPIYTP